MYLSLSAVEAEPFLLLLAGVGLVVGLIAGLRLHPFLALVLAATGVGLLTPAARFPTGTNAWIEGIETVTRQLGVTAGNVGVVIALASIIGMCLGESGAADKVVRRFLHVFGARRAGLALLISSYVLSIPIFFDTFFMLLIPLAQALARRTGKDYTLYVLAICGGGILTHCLVAPHPGPLAMAAALELDLGVTIVAGLTAGLLPLAAAWFVSVRIARRLPIPVRAEAATTEAATAPELPESALPSFAASLTPVFVPILLISGASVISALPDLAARFSALATGVALAGNRNMALLIGTFLGLWLLARQKHLRVRDLGGLMAKPLETAGIIILITSAGGAFGYALRNAGVGDAVKQIADGANMNLVLLAWLVSAVIRVAQGSATVAMLTTAGMMQPVLAAQTPAFHPVYVYLAIGFGSFFMSWMNDSGFWVVSRLGHMTERETLKTLTVQTTITAIAGLIVSMIGAALLPLV